MVRLPSEARDFTLSQTQHTDSWAHTASFPLGTWPSPGIKWPGFESYHSYPPSAEIINAQAYAYAVHIYLYITVRS